MSISKNQKQRFLEFRLFPEGKLESIAGRSLFFIFGLGAIGLLIDKLQIYHLGLWAGMSLFVLAEIVRVVMAIYFLQVILVHFTHLKRKYYDKEQSEKTKHISPIWLLVILLEALILFGVVFLTYIAVSGVDNRGSENMLISTQSIQETCSTDSGDMHIKMLEMPYLNKEYKKYCESVGSGQCAETYKFSQNLDTCILFADINNSYYGSMRIDTATGQLLTTDVSDDSNIVDLILFSKDPKEIKQACSIVSTYSDDSNDQVFWGGFPALIKEYCRK
jgi:hypothetical protein